MKSKTASILFSIAVVMCSVAAVYAQENRPRPKIIAFGSDSPERGTTRVGYWNNEKNMGAGQFAIDYGRPVWRKEYEDIANLDKIEALEENSVVFSKGEIPIGKSYKKALMSRFNII